MLQFRTESQFWNRKFWWFTANFGSPPVSFKKIFLYGGEEKQEPVNLPGELDQRVQIIQAPNLLFLQQQSIRLIFFWVASATQLDFSWKDSA